jgi:His-Xaa-Ser system radical SAM maturase HxsB
MKLLPLRMRALGDSAAVFVNDGGRFFAGSESFLDRFASNSFEPSDWSFLAAEGHAIRDGDALGEMAYHHAVAQRWTHVGPLDYLILVPTLRCNLSCSYCQVSRAPVDRPGFDWSDTTLAAVLSRLDALETDQIKIEFQGGEPTLRPDLITAVMERCERFADRQFVICTNLSRLDETTLALFDHPDVMISTSLDGDAATHTVNRTQSEDETGSFLHNLDFVLSRYGPNKVAALPTLDRARLPDIDALIDSYASRGFTSIYLRPINFHGFARKRHPDARQKDEQWYGYYDRFVRRLIERNWDDRSRVLEESYLSLCLRRIFRPGLDRHVDLRNPNPAGIDYIVIDHDGLVYPTDEARMLSRSGVIDLSIGDVVNGWDGEARARLNEHATNHFDPACQRCTFQPYCGRDLIDDIARYGRIDMPRLETEFCRKHRHLFDLLFEMIYDDEPAVQYSLRRWLGVPGDAAPLGVRHS